MHLHMYVKYVTSKLQGKHRTALVSKMSKFIITTQNTYEYVCMYVEQKRKESQSKIAARLWSLSKLKWQ